jgi:transposase
VELRQSLMKHSVLEQGCELVCDFQRMVNKRDTHPFADWLQACEDSKIPEFINLVAGMKKDNDAIRAALSHSVSLGGVRYRV